MDGHLENRKNGYLIALDLLLHCEKTEKPKFAALRSHATPNRRRRGDARVQFAASVLAPSPGRARRRRRDHFVRRTPGQPPNEDRTARREAIRACFVQSYEPTMVGEPARAVQERTAYLNSARDLFREPLQLFVDIVFDLRRPDLTTERGTCHEWAEDVSMRRRLEQLPDRLGMHLPFISPPGPVQAYHWFSRKTRKVHGGNQNFSIV